MRRASPFSYRCECCGLCCRDKVITLAPYDVMRMADATELGTAEIIAHYTMRRGSLLRFNSDGACAALSAGRCAIHRGRPLACRLYPLGMERGAGGERFIRLEPASGSKGLYGMDGTVGGFLEDQGVAPYLDAVARYTGLLSLMRKRIAGLTDFEKTEPREFRRVAIREALAECGYDYNRLIEALFDSDPHSGLRAGGERCVARHIAALARMVDSETDAAQIASAAALLAVSLGYPPATALAGIEEV
jgi:Fe-S-cluster containining protein